MKVNDEIIKQIAGTDTGFKVPASYFADTFAKVKTELPEHSSRRMEPVSTWHKIRPYLYLAAMFMGIWCMIKMVHLVSTPEADVFDNATPQFIAEAVIEQQAEDELIPDYCTSDFTLEETVADEYSSFSDLEADLNCPLEPEYAEMEVEEYVS